MLGRWRLRRWRAERESQNKVIAQGGRVVAKVRPSRTAKSSAVKIEAVAGSLQAVARVLEGIYIAAPTDGGEGIREPSVYM